ncbi:hypothetical protein BC831DRAFT_59564 [Entophlyctis helioformis]|nr:hypothetical protein BC831DRAFT_59564 [Entophlyctis helioformis]
MSDIPFVVQQSLLSFTVYCSLHILIWVAAPLLVGKRKFKSLTFEDQIYVPERIISTINALGTGLLGFWMLFVDAPFHGPNILHIWTPLMDIFCAWYFGYSAYDLLTMAFQEHHWTMWLHHILGVMGIIGLVAYNKTAVYPVYFMITEFTAILNNLLWYIKAIRDSDVDANERAKAAGSKPPARAPSALYVQTMHVRGWAFVLLRVWVGPYATYVVYREIGSWSGFARDWMALPAPAAVLGLLAVVVLRRSISCGRRPCLSRRRRRTGNTVPLSRRARLQRSNPKRRDRQPALPDPAVPPRVAS